MSRVIFTLSLLFTSLPSNVQLKYNYFKIKMLHVWWENTKHTLEQLKTSWSCFSDCCQLGWSTTCNWLWRHVISWWRTCVRGGVQEYKSRVMSDKYAWVVFDRMTIVDLAVNWAGTSKPTIFEEFIEGTENELWLKVKSISGKF